MGVKSRRGGSTYAHGWFAWLHGRSQHTIVKQLHADKNQFKNKQNKIDNKQGTTAEHRELYLLLCSNLHGKRTCKGTDTCMCITESFCWTSKTDTAS